jgi:hypothetical protein
MSHHKKMNEPVRKCMLQNKVSSMMSHIRNGSDESGREGANEILPSKASLLLFYVPVLENPVVRRSKTNEKEN